MIGAIIGKKMIRSQYDRLNRGDVETFMAGIADGATFIYPDNVSVGGEIMGKKAIDKWFHNLIEHFSKVDITLKNVFVTNVLALGATNIFAVEWNETVTDQDGKDFNNSGVTVIEVVKGKATRIQEYVHDADVLKMAWGE
ncbi:nuclear transport factor 2 family protein [Chloroflexota bacterium]